MGCDAHNDIVPTARQPDHVEEKHVYPLQNIIVECGDVVLTD